MLALGRRHSLRGLYLPLSIAAFVVAFNVVYTVGMLLIPLPKPEIVQIVKSGNVDTGEFAQISWPTSQQAAVGLVGNGTTIINYQEEEPLPIASIAKVITALAVLKKKPLQLDQTGPNITLSADDVALYNSYKAKGGSVVRVTAGEEITQYQAMQAMLLPSANNMAVSLVKWAFGSEAAYVDYANQMVTELGLKNTHVDDASGFSPKTVSTASDLVLLGKQALANPVLAQITSQTEATVPVAGKIVSTNAVLGQAGINGIKTGHTKESGGCFLFAAQREAGGLSVVVVGAVLAAPSIEEARESAPAFVEQAFGNVAMSTGLANSMVVAMVTVPWFQPVNVVSKKQLAQLTWRGAQLQLNVNVLGASTNGVVGRGSLGEDTTELILQQPIPEPSAWWRLTHPIELIGSL